MNYKNPDVLFRIYWNNDASHDFTKEADDHFCSDLLLREEISEKYIPSDNRWSSQHIQGICQTIDYAFEFCHKNGLLLQISIEMPQKANILENLDPIDSYVKNYSTRFKHKYTGLKYFFETRKDNFKKNVSEEKDYNIKILGPHHIIRKGLWCRPLIQNYSGGFYSHHRLTISGGYLNDVFKWIPIEEKLGPCWFDGKTTFKDFFKEDGESFEIAEGDLPQSHVVTKEQIIQEYKNRKYRV